MVWTMYREDMDVPQSWTRNFKPMGIPFNKLPSGKWEILALLAIIRGINSNKLIYQEICGQLKNREKESCVRSVRRALSNLKRKGIVYRKRRYGELYTYLTKEGKIIVLNMGWDV